MNKEHPVKLSKSSDLLQKRAILWSSGLGVALLTICFVYWAKAQQFEDVQAEQLVEQEQFEQPNEPVIPEEAPLDPAVVRQAKRLAILDPINFERELSKFKTQKDLDREELKRFSISNPKEYSRHFDPPKDEARLRYEEKSMLAITKPAKYSAEVEKRKTPEQKQADQEALDAILYPRVRSDVVPVPEFNN